MTQTLSFKSLSKASLADAGRMILPSLPWTGLFLGMWVYLIWFAASYPEGGIWTLIFFGLALLTLFTHSLFSVSLYRAVLPHEAGILKSGWKLTLAWLLVITVMAIVAAGIALFFAVVAVSFGIASTDTDPGQVTNITNVLHESGIFPFFLALLMASFVWVFWFVTRLMTFAAATSSLAHIHVFRTWGWTKGHFKSLGPALLLMVALPIALGAGLAQILGGALFGQPETPITLALQSGLAMLLGVPAAWLGHALAANVYKTVADQGHIDQL